jgi:hypothetical protein
MNLRKREAWVACLGGGFLAIAIAGFAIYFAAELTPPPGEVPYVRTLDQPASLAERSLIRGDGQFFWMLADDPGLRHPEVLRGPAAEFAYRAQRPLLGWLGSVTSFGRTGLIAWSLYFWMVVGAVVLVLGSLRLARVAGRSAARSGLFVLLPGSATILITVGPEGLGAGLALLAVALLVEQRRTGVAVGMLCLTALLRESFLLLSGGFALWLLLRGDVRRGWLTLAAPAMTFGAWISIVHVRVGYWPWESGQRRLGLPGQGLLAASKGWAMGDGIMLGLIVALCAVAVVRTAEERSLVLCLMTPSLGLAVVMGELVWVRWEDFSRPLLGATAVAATFGLTKREAGVRADGLDNPVSGGTVSPPP